jgi:hypothetical protein
MYMHSLPLLAGNCSIKRVKIDELVPKNKIDELTKHDKSKIEVTIVTSLENIWGSFALST